MLAQAWTPTFLMFFSCASFSASAPSASLDIFPNTLSNLTIAPWIQCASGSERLSDSARRECKSAIAFLPLPSDEVADFGPDVQSYIFRTPIISDHATRCTARVDIRRGFSTDRSSWKEVRKVFWEMSAECLDVAHSTGMAHMGEKHGLELRLIYDSGHFLELNESMAGFEGRVAGVGSRVHAE